MGAAKNYRIFTASGEPFVVSAPSLRTALRGFDEKAHGAVVAAVEESCMPHAEDDRPFLAVFLKSPNFKPPEDLG